MDVLGNMALFVEVVRQRSFLRAAEELGMPVSTLSRRISAFEKQLGLKLLHRTTRKVEPTHEGQLYYQRCAPLVNEARLAHEDLSSARDGLSGTLRVSCTPDFAGLHLQPMLEAFLQQHPKLQLELDLTVRRVDLFTESVDAALRFGHLKSSSLVARRIADFPSGLFASPGFIHTHGQPQEPTELSRWPCLRMGSSDNYRQWQLTPVGQSGQRQSVWVQGRVVANSMQMLEQFCRAGHGIALLDLKAAAAGLREGRLVQILPQWQGVGVPLQLVTASRMVPARVRAFGDALQRHFARG